MIAAAAVAALLAEADLAMGPTRMRFAATLRGKPANEAWLAAADAAFDFFDANKDGKLSAAERKGLGSPPRARRGQPVDADADAVQLFEADEPPADRETFRAKIAAAGRGPLSITVRQGRDDAAASEALFRLLDMDGDGRLSPAELAAGPARIAACDQNDDEYIIPNELPTPAARPRGRRPERDPSPPLLLALPLDPAAALAAVFAARDADKNRTLDADELPGFAASDKDGNKKIDDLELAFWLKRSPAARIELTLPGTAPALPAVPGFRIEIAVGPAPSGGAVAALFSHGRGESDALLPLGDRNGDGKLDDAEQAAVRKLLAITSACRVELAVTDHGRGLFPLLDTDHDGRLSPRELLALKTLSTTDFPEVVTATVSVVGLGLNGEAAVAGPQPTWPTPPEWFAAMDTNGDGEISRREFLGPASAFAKLDTNGDGLISVAEALAAGK